MLRLLCFLALVVAAAAADAAKAQDSDDAFIEVYARLGIDLPQRVAKDTQVSRRLSELKREPCDQQSITELAQALDKLGYRREAAESQYNFVRHCGAPLIALHRSIEIFRKLSDHKRAFEVADEYVKRAPTIHDAHYLRGLSFQQLGDYRRALVDYANAIELFNTDKKEINSRIFMRMAEAYAALGQFCEAATPIQTWIAFDPARRETSQTQKLIFDYELRGNCVASQELQRERYPLRGSNRVVTVPTVINGIRGNFIIDTGASYVSMKTAFADRAKIPHAAGSDITLVTASGQTKGKLSKAERVQLGKLQAVHVPVVVQKGDGIFGAGIDGLLGMSFLSRFEVQIASGFIEIRTRGKKK